MTTEELSSTHRADYQTPDFNKLKSNNDLQNSSQSLSNSGSDSQRALVWWIKNTIGTSEILLTRTKNSIRLLTLSFCHVVWLFKALGKFQHSVNHSKSLCSHFKRQRRARFPLIHCRSISRNYPGKIGENHVMATDKKLQALAPSSHVTALWPMNSKVFWFSRSWRTLQDIYLLSCSSHNFRVYCILSPFPLSATKAIRVLETLGHEGLPKYFPSLRRQWFDLLCGKLGIHGWVFSILQMNIVRYALQTIICCRFNNNKDKCFVLFVLLSWDKETSVLCISFCKVIATFTTLSISNITSC